MEAKTKKRIIIWTSVAIVLGIGGYFTYNYLKEKGIIGNKPTDTSGGDSEISQDTSGGGGGANTSPTAEQTALATSYRIWANSSDALSKKYGKKSSFDLDASRSNPYGGTFLKSYDAGKAEYDAYLKTQGSSTTPPPSSTNQNQIEQITKIASRYKQPIQGHSKGGQFVTLFFGAKFQGSSKAFKVNIFEKNPTSGVKSSNGNLFWVLYDSNWSTFSSYESLTYITKAMGTLRYDNGKYVGTNLSGIGKGANGNNVNITQFIQQVTNNQIYGVFDYSRIA